MQPIPIHYRSAIYTVGDRLAGAKICGYSGCYSMKIAITLQALPFYRIKVDQLSFWSLGASLYCPTVRDAMSAATLLKQFSQVVHSATSGGYANSDRGWVEVYFQPDYKPVVLASLERQPFCLNSIFGTLQNGVFLREASQ
ncbi:hypothetical protein ACQ4M5_07175 [Leptolyngbya sp. AN10]